MKNFEKINITGRMLLKNEELIRLRGGDDPIWSGCCAVHHQNKVFWKYIDPWTWNGTGKEAEDACTEHVNGEEEGAYCFCNYIDE